MKILEQIQNNDTISLLLGNKRAILITLILILGMVAGLYLIRQQQILKSRAAAGQTIPPIGPYSEGKEYYIDQFNPEFTINKDSFEQ